MFSALLIITATSKRLAQKRWPTFDGNTCSRGIWHMSCVNATIDQPERRKQCNFLKQYGMSVYFEEVSKKINICFEDFVKLVCLPEILKKKTVFGYSVQFKINL